MLAPIGPLDAPIKIILCSDFKVIKNPKPNIIETEKQYVQLEKIKTIDANLENGINIFKPFSISLSNDPDNVYIYDKIQSLSLIFILLMFVLPFAFGIKKPGASARVIFYVCFFYSVGKFFIPFIQ